MISPSATLPTRLYVALHADVAHTPEGTAEFNAVRGGPNLLLTWLENQLGLRGPDAPFTHRIVQHLRRLEAVPDSSYRQSLNVDRWSTAEDLLKRRDELWLAGWDGTETPGLPAKVRDLAKAEAVGGPLHPGTPERLHSVLQALDGGRCLPPHTLTLDESPSEWPLLWQKVLARLHVTRSPSPYAHSNTATSLHEVQVALLAGTSANVAPDATLRVVLAGSRHTACHAVAALLRVGRQAANRITVYCEDEQTALMLDAMLESLALPTMGVARRSNAQPAFQVLPLALQLCREPVNPYVLLDFLLLPVSPIKRSVAYKLASALEKQPGYGSDAWNRVAESLLAPEADPDSKLKERLDAWFDCQRIPFTQDYPIELVRDRCKLVARWAAGRAQLLEDSADADEGLINALKSAASQASALGELAATYGTTISEPQLERILDAVMNAGATAVPHAAKSGGPTWVASLAQVPQGTDLLIWLETTTERSFKSTWEVEELRELRAAGIAIDTDQTMLRSYREAERRGLVAARSLAVVQIQTNEEARTHPLWLQVASTMPEAKVPRLENLLAGEPNALWSFELEPHKVLPPQPVRSTWSVPPQLIEAPASFSATSMQTQLGCPLKWFLQYGADIRPSPIVSIPEDNRLKGLFAHDLLAQVFGGGGPLPSADEACRQVEQSFDRLLARNAAPLAQPRKIQEKDRLLDTLLSSTKALVQALERGEYHVKAMETQVLGEVRGKPLKGSIDCLIDGPAGEAVVDFKLGGADGFKQMLEEGTAVQLATYAHARETMTGNAVHGVAYLILERARLLTPTGSPLAGAGVSEQIPGPAIQLTWNNFQAALDRASGWLGGSEPIVARPLQATAIWPEGVSLVLDPEAKREQDVCRFCEFGVFCGLRRMT
jgi:ATP-dependent helicase/nuclease subunit B